MHIEKWNTQLHFFLAMDILVLIYRWQLPSITVRNNKHPSCLY
jgi:hypothetical protein